MTRIHVAQIARSQPTEVNRTDVVIDYIIAGVENGVLIHRLRVAIKGQVREIASGPESERKQLLVVVDTQMTDRSSCSVSAL